MFRFLSSAQPIELSFLRVPRFCFRFVGFWPEAYRSWPVVLQFCLSTLLVAVGAIGETGYGFLHISDVSQALEAFCPSLTKIISVLKMLTIFTYRRQFRDFILQLEQMVMRAADRPTKRRIMEKLAGTANKLSFMLLASGNATNVCFSTLPLVKMIYRYRQDRVWQHLLPFKIIIPHSQVLENPVYPFSYFFLTLSGVMTVFTFSAVDGFFVCATFYMSGLFRLLQHDIRRLFAELEGSTKASAAQNRRLRAGLRRLVQRHNAIIDLCSLFTQKFAVIVLWHFVSAALVLCCSILDMMLNSSSLGVLLYFCYSVAALTQLFLYCIGSSRVSESSVAVADVLYEIDWYKCEPKTRKMIQLMMCRAQRSTTIAVPFFTPSLMAFKSIISSAGSYITLLKTFL